MENYTYTSYPDSGDSSPRSREIEFENPPPWDDQQPPPNYKAKFICSYGGGKIQPRSHDNQLSYVGGETKILAVDRNIKFPAMISKLSALCDADVTFKYQLPGEDLDALISVTNDDDLEHMMHEYDRLYRPSAKPVRMRLFLFPVDNQPPASFGSDRDRFVEALNTGPGLVPPDPVKNAPGANNVDFLFGLDKGVPPAAQPPPVGAKFHDPVPEPVAPPPEYQVRGVAPGDRVPGSDPVVSPIEMQRQLQQEMQRLQISEQEQAAYRRRSEDNLVGGYPAGDYYVQKFPEKAPSSNVPATAQHPGYWPGKQVPGDGFPATVSGGDQAVYVIPAPGTFYHAPIMRAPAVPAPATQGYYTVQRMASDGYREQPMYSAVQPPKAPFSSAPATMAPAQQVKPSTYAEGYGVVRPAGMPDNINAAPYAQLAYDSAAGRQVYYTAPSGVMHSPPYQGVAPAVSADNRPPAVASMGQEVKAVNKVSQGSV
ncbi:hypothetical protein L6164_032678 [Bauhinia variegata]|uniref:Uncharacterized protein n=1 Tax=Bauhinia variegata TaxID=167791 RepID=A0ACB9KPC8_BAUVA|nr:hypothetical protein L6164_032678 [Bauhinia variegata]